MEALKPAPKPPRRPLPVTLVRGMTVVAIQDGTPGVIEGITEAFCIFRLEGSDTLCVASWQDLAVGNLCPAEPLLPREVVENDRRNTAACVLSELLRLQHVRPLTAAQQAVLDELVADLCGQP